jgi:hypothetical protein
MANTASKTSDTKTMDRLRVQTQLKSRYPVFDASGQLPFDIVFGLRRKLDSDRRDISFQTAHSFLDVPYALAKGLLRIHELRPSETGPDEHVEVDLSALRDAVAADGDEAAVREHITLPSKSNKKEKRGQLGVTEYRYRVKPGSPLAACFEIGKRYSIGLVNRDLGTHRWIDSDHVPPSDKADIETCALVSNPHGGFAVFNAVESLTWPPPIETRMQLVLPDPGQTNENSEKETPDHPNLRITVTNTGFSTISIQTRGQQHFLDPWGPFQPESDDGLNAGRRPTILDSPSAGSGNLRIVNVATGAVVRDSPKSGVCGLTAGRPDLRPKLEDLVVLEPSVAHSREIELERLVRGLKDGRYAIRLNPKGCWWCFGEIAESDPDDGSKVPKRIYGAKHQMPVVLQSDDEVGFSLKDGRVVQD